MINKIIGFVALFVTTFALAHSPLLYGPNSTSLNLQQNLQLTSSGPGVYQGSSDPTLVAVSANAGSIYLRTNGSTYNKQDSGLSTNWTLLGASGPGSGVTTVGGIDTNGAFPNALSITGTSIYAQSASVARPGMINNATQGFSGLKNFSTGLGANMSAISTAAQNIGISTTSASMNVDALWNTATQGQWGGTEGLNILSGTFHINSGTPISDGQIVVGDNVGVSLNAEDNYPADSSGLHIGFVNNGSVGKVDIATGKTVDAYNASASVIASNGTGGNGTMTNASLYRAIGAVGGSTVFTNLYGFNADTNLDNAGATNLWGVYVPATTADNWFKKDVVIGGSTGKPTSASFAFDVAGSSNLIPNTPASVGTTPGTAATNGLTISGGVGGASSIVTTGVGGVGAGETVTLGAGGQATAAATSSTGGVGGAYSLTSGVGGAAAVAGTGDNHGGVGGALTIASGAGGAATGNTNGDNTGGDAGTLNVTGGTGGAATTGTGNLIPGNGGAIVVSGGTAGAGTSSAKSGGAVTIRGGLAAAQAGSGGGAVNITARGGSGTGSGGAGGNIVMTAGSAGGDNTVSRAAGAFDATAGNAKGDQLGGEIAYQAGVGGGGTGAVGATGGLILYTAGAGGSNATNSGPGGPITFVSGPGGSGGTPGYGGDITFKTPTTTAQGIRLVVAGGPVPKITAYNSVSTAPFVLTDAATIATDASLSNVFRVTLAASRTLGAPTNPSNGQMASWEFIQGGAGSNTITLNGAFVLGAGVPSVTLSTAVGSHDVMSAIYNSTTTKWYVTGLTSSGGGSVPAGGTGLTSLTQYGIPFGNGTSPVTVTAAGTRYQTLQAGLGGVPLFDAVHLDQPAAVSGVLGVTQMTIGTRAISALDLDWSSANVFKKTLSANTVFTFSNKTDGQTIVAIITNTASNYTVTWPTVSWVGGTPPVQTVGAHTDVLTFVYDGTTIWGNSVQNF